MPRSRWLKGERLLVVAAWHGAKRRRKLVKGEATGVGRALIDRKTPLAGLVPWRQQLPATRGQGNAPGNRVDPPRRKLDPARKAVGRGGLNSFGPASS